MRTYFLYRDEGLIAEYDAQGNELRSYGWPPDATWGTPPQLVAQNGAARWRDRDMRLRGSVFTWPPVLPHLTGGGTIFREYA